ncbi:MAG: oligosaccharide flippase family protein, partial [Bacteroidota bacterium]|nr:oligosaccharide flippase family protein [Bacteroidota bacterium]
MKINQKYKVAILKTVKDKIKNNRILLFNFTSLSILQICNYIFPLITLPYLVRVLGPDHFGIVSFIIAFTGYFGMITDYGFNLSGTQTVSINRLDRNKLNSIYSSILFIKLFLFVVCIVVFTLCLVSIDRFRADWLAYLAGFLSILGNVLFPIWLFMGLEKMKYVSMINIYMKILFTGSVFIFISNQNDTVLYLFLYSLHLVLIGVVGLFISFYKLKIKFIIPSKNELKYHFREGWYVFLSTFSISLYTISNTFILGLFASNEVVGYFSAADKIRGAVQGFYSAISQSVYPHLSALFVASKESALK